MTASVKTSITANILTTLAAVDGTAPYNYNLSRTQQVTLYGRHPSTFSTWPSIVVEETGDAGDLGQTCGYDERTAKLTLICAVREGDEAAARASAQALVADIQRALHADYTRGGYAWDTHVDDSANEFDVATLPIVTFTVGVTVNYRHGVKDPTSLAPSM